ncbi:methionyl-tRNA formyltransferase [Patescibacteria group bacterium]|nr:methionyl-tRNA formyltransferase [Patescibacteria group bacterium]
MKVVFFGTPGFSADFLASLINDSRIEVLAVVTQPDKTSGRKKIITPSKVKLLAESQGIKVLQPENLKNENFIDDLTKLNPDLFVVVAYGKIIPETILQIAKRGAINVHPSLLPKYRGPSPIQSVIVDGEKVSGVTIMLMDKMMDHGPILSQVEIPIFADETVESFMKKSVKIGAPLLAKTIVEYFDNKISAKEQGDDKATFCKLVKRENGEINFLASAEKIERMNRAYYPWPGIYFNWKNTFRLKIHKMEISSKKLEPGQIYIEENRLYIGTATKAIELLEVQPENKNKMSAKAFLLGLK